MNTRNKALLLSVTLIITTLACGLENIQVVESPNLEATITAQALLLAQDGQATAVDPAAQQVIVVTATIDPAAAPEVVVAAAVVAPATGPVTVTVSTATNCRSGPGQNFAILYGMPIGQVAEVVAKNTFTGYWIIKIPNGNGATCWLWGQYATVVGDTSPLTNVVTPTSAAPTKTNTPSPTATPTVTVVTKPIAPLLTGASVVCVDQLNGTRQYNVQLNWTDNSNNETQFDFTISPSNAFYASGPNTTSFSFSQIYPAGTVVSVGVSASNSAGSSPVSSNTVVCP